MPLPSTISPLYSWDTTAFPLWSPECNDLIFLALRLVYTLNDTFGLLCHQQPRGLLPTSFHQDLLQLSPVSHWTGESLVSLQFLVSAGRTASCAETLHTWKIKSLSPSTLWSGKASFILLLPTLKGQMICLRTCIECRALELIMAEHLLSRW